MKASTSVAPASAVSQCAGSPHTAPRMRAPRASYTQGMIRAPPTRFGDFTNGLFPFDHTTRTKCTISTYSNDTYDEHGLWHCLFSHHSSTPCAPTLRTAHQTSCSLLTPTSPQDASAGLASAEHASADFGGKPTRRTWRFATDSARFGEACFGSIRFGGSEVLLAVRGLQHLPLSRGSGRAAIGRSAGALVSWSHS